MSMSTAEKSPDYVQGQRDALNKAIQTLRERICHFDPDRYGTSTTNPVHAARLRDAISAWEVAILLLEGDIKTLGRS